MSFAPSFRRTVAALALGVVAAFAPRAEAAVNKTLCVYDPGGASGDAFQNAKRYQAAATGWGVNFTLKPYTDEAVAAADFRNKQCDAALITGVRVQQFNRKTYSVEALGLIPDYATLKKAVTVLAQPKAASLMVSGEFETAGIFPAGAIVLFVNDRAVSNASALAGKRICTMSFDNAAKTMVGVVGASPISADVGTFASKFNNGSCDVAYAPAAAFNPLELYKGVGAKGGVVDFPLAQLTYQVLIRPADFPADFGQQSRTWSVTQFDAVLATINKAAAGVKADLWMKIAGEDAVRYKKLLSDTRNKLVAGGSYDATVVKLLEQLAAKP
jgi:hypothetical protein